MHPQALFKYRKPDRINTLDEYRDQGGYAALSEVIAKNDPYCRGVVVLGLGAREDAIAEAFRAAAPWPLVKGFAVGRSIFWTAAEAWFAGRLDDNAAVAAMAARLAAFLEIWERAREES